MIRASYGLFRRNLSIRPHRFEGLSYRLRHFSSLDLHSFGKFAEANENDRSAPHSTEKTETSSDTEPKGKVVHPVGSPRQILRSELYGMKIYLEEGPNDRTKEDGRTRRIIIVTVFYTIV